MTKQDLTNLKKTEKLTKSLEFKFDKIINTLKTKRDDLDQYDVDDLFSEAVKLTKYDNVDCDILTPMLNYNIQDGYPYILDLEDDIGDIPEKEIDNDSPEAVTKENMLSFVENNFIYHSLEWYVTNDDETKVKFINIDTAINAITEMRNSASVF